MIRKIIYFIDNAMMAFAVVAIAAMMLTIVYDAALRYVLGSASTLSYTLSEAYLMTGIVFLGVAYTKKMDGHTRVLLFFKFFPKTLRKIFDLISNIATFAVFGLIGYLGLTLTMKAYLNTEVYIGLINWPMYLAYIIIPIGSLAMVF